MKRTVSVVLELEVKEDATDREIEHAVSLIFENGKADAQRTQNESFNDECETDMSDPGLGVALSLELMNVELESSRGIFRDSQDDESNDYRVNDRTGSAYITSDVFSIHLSRSESLDSLNIRVYPRYREAERSVYDIELNRAEFLKMISEGPCESLLCDFAKEYGVHITPSKTEQGRFLWCAAQTGDGTGESFSTVREAFLDASEYMLSGIESKISGDDGESFEQSFNQLDC